VVYDILSVYNCQVAFIFIVLRPALFSLLNIYRFFIFCGIC